MEILKVQVAVKSGFIGNEGSNSTLKAKTSHNKSVQIDRSHRNLLV